MADKTDKTIVNLNLITRKQFLDFMSRLQAEGTPDEKSIITGELVELVIEDWPYKQPVTVDGYNALGMLDSVEVDNALTDAMVDLTSKNLARRSISPANSALQ